MDLLLSVLAVVPVADQALAMLELAPSLSLDGQRPLPLRNALHHR